MERACGERHAAAAPTAGKLNLMTAQEDDAATCEVLRFLRPRKPNPKTGPFVGADSSPQTNPRLPPTHAGCFSRKKRCSSTYFAENAFCLQTWSPSPHQLPVLSSASPFLLRGASGGGGGCEQPVTTTKTTACSGSKDTRAHQSAPKHVCISHTHSLHLLHRSRARRAVL